MIDIHVHILPGLDDGPGTQKKALGMARAAVKDGIQTIIATPHTLNGVFLNWRKDILAACNDFNIVLKEENIPLTVLPGSEVRLNPEIIDELSKGRIMTMNDAGKFLCLELPEQFIVKPVIAFINQLNKQEITPIITHPERNALIQQDNAILSQFISAGALSQITAGSLAGRFGKKASKCCIDIVNQGIFHFVASDAHSSGRRPPRLSIAFKKLKKMIGSTAAEKIMMNAPDRIIQG